MPHCNLGFARSAHDLSPFGDGSSVSILVSVVVLANQRAPLAEEVPR